MEQAESQRRKEEIRVEAAARRRRQEDAALESARIFDRLAAMPEYLAAKTVMSYVSFRSEVATGPFMARAQGDGKRVVVPFCVGPRLELFRLGGFDELAPGTRGILEPKQELRTRPDRCVAVEELDVIVVPGLAFDSECGRIGYGKGYYDRLLAAARPESLLAAVAFQCQIFPEIPMLAYDIRVDRVITEAAVYRRNRPRFDRR